MLKPSLFPRNKHFTCCLKYLRSSVSIRTKFRKYLTENFLFISRIVGVKSYPARNTRIGILSPEMNCSNFKIFRHRIKLM